MSLNLTTEVQCDFCKKKMKCKVETNSVRRSTRFLISNAYTVSDNDYDGLFVSRGFTYIDSDDFKTRSCVCSMDCVVGMVRRKLPKTEMIE